MATITLPTPRCSGNRAKVKWELHLRHYRIHTAAQLDDISRDLPEHERLLICAPAFDIGLGKRYENINVRKIPQSVLDKCEYGADNYNLNIINPPELDEDEWEDGEDA